MAGMDDMKPDVMPWEIVLKRFLAFGGAPTKARYLA
jgi:hypothetical protein